MEKPLSRLFFSVGGRAYNRYLEASLRSGGRVERNDERTREQNTSDRHTCYEEGARPYYEVHEQVTGRYLALEVSAIKATGLSLTEVRNMKSSEFKMILNNIKTKKNERTS